MSLDHLFNPVDIGSLRLKHRGIMPSMVTNLCGTDGSVTDRFIAYHVARARGGVALNITEAAYVHVGGKGFPNQLGIDDDVQVEGLTRLTEAVHEAGGRIAVQLYHGGRQSNPLVTGGTVVAPSPIPCPVVGAVPHELTVTEIAEIVDAFVLAGRRAQQAGFNAIEIHGAHGYLLNEFLSPRTNHRDDEYGRDPAGRARFPLEIVDRLRSALGPAMPLIYRITADEFLPDGLTVADTCAFCVRLVEHGIDAIDVSGGTYESGRTAAGPDEPLGVFVEAAAAIKHAIGGAVPVAVANRIKTPAFADAVIASGRADLVATGRALLCDADFYAKASAGEDSLIRTCLSCNHCMSELMSGRAVTCLYNPLTGREVDHPSEPATSRRDVVVVGGGIAGMEAANTAARRGHSVRLFEATDQLGGHMIAGVRPPLKSEMAACLVYEQNALAANGVEVSLNHPVDTGFLARCGADAILVATGSDPVRPPVPGIDGPEVVTAEDVLLDRVVVGGNVGIIGAGSVGIETAEFLIERGKTVTVLEMGTDILSDLAPTLRAPLEARIRGTLTRIELDARVVDIREGCVATSRGSFGPFDTVVLAAGYQPDRDLSRDLEAAGIPHVVVGDAVSPRRIYEAVSEAFEAAYAIT